MDSFKATELLKLWRASKNSSGEQNGQLTIIGGSSLFHGAPFLSLLAASRIVDMVFFSSPYEPLRDVAAYLKSQIQSFIWVPFDEVEDYIKKSDAALIGPGLMRARSEDANHKHTKSNGDFCDEECQKTRDMTKKLLGAFPQHKWVIDAGSLQVMDADWIPENAIVTPNSHEYEGLFGDMKVQEAATQYKCLIVQKGPTSIVASSTKSVEIIGGNEGMTKGGTGDVLAGVTAALLTKNEPFLAAASASYIVKAAGDLLYSTVGPYYNADDLADEVSRVMGKLV